MNHVQVTSKPALHIASCPPGATTWTIRRSSPSSSGDRVDKSDEPQDLQADGESSMCLLEAWLGKMRVALIQQDVTAWIVGDCKLPSISNRYSYLRSTELRQLKLHQQILHTRLAVFATGPSSSIPTQHSGIRISLFDSRTVSSYSGPRWFRV